MIIGTAGHIDHGKTALVRALTGVETDRLPEERRRGITIELGFAPLVLEGVGTLGIVDVPGHEAFVRTMLAGAAGVDLALLVVAADEGPMPQTREHLAILSLLAVQGGVIALTKSDLVEPEWLGLVTEELRVLLAGTPLADAAIIPVSAHSGAGIPELRVALAAAARAIPARDPHEPFRLPIDRVFSVAGAGTVVTGTAWSGRIAVDDEVRILPSDRSVRVRSLESHGAARERSAPGDRLAVALAGIDRDAVAPRGALLVRRGDPWSSTTVIRADVALLEGAPTLRLRSRVRFHLGTAEVGARLVMRGGTLAPGATQPVRIVLDAPIVARAGDRFVLRGGPAFTTIGGGLVTDPTPPRTRARPFLRAGATPAERLQWLLDESGNAGLRREGLALRLGVSASQLERLLRDAARISTIGDALVRGELLDAARAQLLQRLDAQHRDQPLAPGAPLQRTRDALSANALFAAEVIRRAQKAGLVEVEGAIIRRAGFAPGAAERAQQAAAALRARLVAAGAEPPSVSELTAELGPEVPALLRLLEREGAVVAIASDRWYAREAVETLLQVMQGRTTPGRLYPPSELREIFGFSRKYLIPLLEWCDREGITRREGDGRRFLAIPASPRHP